MQTRTKLSRFKASFIHLLISAALVGSVFTVVFWAWYPSPAFEVAGASSIIVLLVVVDLVLGPLLTLVVFKQGKPGLKFDLTVIALVQLAALLYGSFTLYEERPYYLVFSVDRLEFVARKDIDESELRFDALRDKPVDELIRVFARAPDDADEFQRFLDSVIFDGKPDLERRAEFWEPWQAGIDNIRDAITPVAELDLASEQERAALDKAVARHKGRHENLGTLPIGGIEEDLGVLMDIDTLKMLEIIEAYVY